MAAATSLAHKLVIVSLHDAQASCLCGGWNFARTGSATLQEICSEWQAHERLHATLGGKEPIRSLHIEGRRWFQRGPGNTYYSVRIWINGTQVVVLPFQYGYGEQWLQTALDWLRAEKWIEPGENYGTMYLRETLGGTYSVIDVERKKEL